MVAFRTAKGKSMSIGVVAADLDRTLTDAKLRVVPAALKAMRDLRARGVHAVLVTGRTRSELLGRKALLHSFDALVLESGGLVAAPNEIRQPAPPAPALDRLAKWLDQRSIDYRRGDTTLSVSAEDEARVAPYPRIDDRFQRHHNRDRVDITAVGVSKGVGLKAWLAGQAVPAGDVLAFGDAANDLSLFRAADYRVAVANADPLLLQEADEVTRKPAGHGVAEFIRERLLGNGAQ